MDPKSKERLVQILEKSPEVLAEDEIDFLRARRSYLKQSQLDEYASVINKPNPEEERTVKNAQRPRKAK